MYVSFNNFFPLKSLIQIAVSWFHHRKSSYFILIIVVHQTAGDPDAKLGENFTQNILPLDRQFSLLAANLTPSLNTFFILTSIS